MWETLVWIIGNLNIEVAVTSVTAGLPIDVKSSPHFILDEIYVSSVQGRVLKL